jgi:tRNA 5-methylaminomethyl-2-thiouridine biosynthesis bifunctional protein
MVNPRLQKQRDAVGDFYMSAFLLARRQLRALQALQDIGYRECGTLFLISDDKQRVRYEAACASFDPAGEIMACVGGDRASAIASIEMDREALWLSVAGCVCPYKLCRAMAADAEIYLNTPIKDLEAEREGWRVNGELFDAVILAAGPGVLQFAQTGWLPLSTVRGQLSCCRPGKISSRLACNLNYGGYCTPAFDGEHVLGASFEPERNDTEIDRDTSLELLARLGTIAPELAGDMNISTDRAALRVAAKDRRPVIGPVPDKDLWQSDAPVYHNNLYISTAYGSHGVIAAFAGAQVIADDMLGRAHAFSKPSLRGVAPARFLERYVRKGRM